jgi:hypothetical protein
MLVGEKRTIFLDVLEGDPSNPAICLYRDGVDVTALYAEGSISYSGSIITLPTIKAVEPCNIVAVVGYDFYGGREMHKFGIEILSPDFGSYTSHVDFRKFFTSQNACPYCDTEDIEPIKPSIPGAPDICPNCGGWL